MLKYIQNSTKNNVTNEDIASIQNLIIKVKRKKEVGINYMKSWEVEEMMRKEAFEDGYNEGTERMNQLIILLTEVKRTDDLLKAANDAPYRDRLFEEFNL